MSAYEDRTANIGFNNRPSKAGLLGLAWPLMVLVVCAVFLVWWFWPHGSGLNANAHARPVDPRGEYTTEEKVNISVYEKAAPAVVHVTNVRELRNSFNLDLQQIHKGTGSGFVWDEEGHIVTNYHVIDGADSAKVILADHSTYDVRKVWSYPDKDIAVLWINAPKEKLRPILIGSSHDLKVGQSAFAIGNPFGLDQTMTNGIVSALGREVQSPNGNTIQGAIQTSAAINPGNSGGPLLDSFGRLIGMNTSIISPSGAFAGIGFAIPVDDINQVVTELIQKGKIVRPRIGVQLADEQLAQQLGVKKGALIWKVVPDSPAGQAGLKGTRVDENAGRISRGDIIVAVDGKAISKVQDLHAAMEKRKVGDTIDLTIERDGQRQDVKITLKAME
jgi:S1-C subfamily serine protease